MDRTGHDRTRQRTGQDRIAQDRTGEDSSRQDRTGQEGVNARPDRLKVVNSQNLMTCTYFAHHVGQIQSI